MEDKLTKTNHGPAYYYFKKITTCFGIFLVACAVVAIPVSIAASISIGSDNSETSDTTNEAVELTEEDSSLLSY